MPLQYGSCLNEEYTRIVTQIYALLNEAKEKYEELPACLRDVGSNLGSFPESFGYYLINSRNAAYLFAKEFGIEVEK